MSSAITKKGSRNLPNTLDISGIYWCSLIAVVPEPGGPGGHYASTISVYPDISGHWDDVNQSGRPVYQNVAHEKLLEQSTLS